MALNSDLTELFESQCIAFILLLNDRQLVPRVRAQLPGRPYSTQAQWPRLMLLGRAECLRIIVVVEEYQEEWRIMVVRMAEQ